MSSKRIIYSEQNISAATYSNATDDITWLVQRNRETETIQSS